MTTAKEMKEIITTMASSNKVQNIEIVLKSWARQIMNKVAESLNADTDSEVIQELKDQL